MQTIDLEALNPVERMELADALYDSAMQQVEFVEPLLTAEQRAELDRRIERVHSGTATLIPWEEAYARLTASR